MKNLYAIWIDHSHALIVKADQNDVISVQPITSDVEAKHHSGVTEEHLTIVNQHKHDERRNNQMHQFCKRLIETVSDADEIVVFGPGTAKHEFKNELEKNHALSGKLTAVETTDSMTENQLKAYAREVLELPRN